MPGLVHVGIPTADPAPAIGVVGASYGWMDASGDVPGGSRMAGSVAASVAPVPQLRLGFDARGFWDKYSTENNLYSEPRLSGRFSHALSKTFLLGIEADARFLGEEAPSLNFAATSPSLRALLAAQLGSETWLAGQLGYHLNRSAETIPSPRRLSAPDRRSISASSWNGLPWGLGVSTWLQDLGAELFAELSGEVPVGTGSPAVLVGPARGDVGMRRRLSTELSLRAHLEVGFSKRPTPFVADNLVEVEPRAGLGLALIWQLGLPPPPVKAPPKPRKLVKPKPAPKPAPKPVKAPLPVNRTIRGVVLDEGGRPLSDVQVLLKHEGSQPVEIRTYADGSFEFKEAPQAALTVEIHTPGFEPLTRQLAAGGEPLALEELLLRPAVPAGQVRGRISNLRGEPVMAQISVGGSDQRILIQEDGSFEVELSPGSYTIRFKHKDFANQQRRVKVHDRGVVILNIALTR